LIFPRALSLSGFHHTAFRQLEFTISNIPRLTSFEKAKQPHGTAARGTAAWLKPIRLNFSHFPRFIPHMIRLPDFTASPALPYAGAPCLGATGRLKNRGFIRDNCGGALFSPPLSADKGYAASTLANNFARL